MIIVHLVRASGAAAGGAAGGRGSARRAVRGEHGDADRASGRARARASSVRASGNGQAVRVSPLDVTLRNNAITTIPVGSSSF